jgi:transcriptional pleiotropic regulator of transition state genes
MKVVKVSSNGRVTIPIEVRTSLGIGKGASLAVTLEGDEIVLRKLPVRPLSDQDPIWRLIGIGESRR